MAIDVHAHYIPQEYLDFLGVPFEVAMEPVSAPTARLSLDERISLMNEHGVTAQLISISLLQPYQPDVKLAVETAHLGNDIYKATCDAYRGRLYGLGCIPLPHVEEALAEMARCLDDLAMMGISLGCSVAGRQLDDPIFDPVYAELSRREACLVLHPMGQGLGEPMNGYRLNWLIGALFEDTIAALRLAYAKVPSRFPGMKIIVPHLGGTIPFHLARLTRQSDEVAAELKKMWFDTVTDQPGALETTVQALGSDRLLFGTDFPWASRAEFGSRLERLSKVGLPDDEVVAIRGARAEKLFGLPTT